MILLLQYTVFFQQNLFLDLLQISVTVWKTPANAIWFSISYCFFIRKKTRHFFSINNHCMCLAFKIKVTKIGVRLGYSKVRLGCSEVRLGYSEVGLRDSEARLGDSGLG